MEKTIAQQVFETIQKEIEYEPVLPLTVARRVWVLQAIKEHNGNKAAAARQLNITDEKLARILGKAPRKIKSHDYKKKV